MAIVATATLRAPVHQSTKVERVINKTAQSALASPSHPRCSPVGCSRPIVAHSDRNLGTAVIGEFAATETVRLVSGGVRRLFEC